MKNLERFGTRNASKVQRQYFNSRGKCLRSADAEAEFMPNYRPAVQIRIAQPIRKAIPPAGVIAPSQRIPVKLRR